MKKKLFVLMSALCVGLSGCGTPIQSVVNEVSTEENTGSSETIGQEGFYPKVTSYMNVAMGMEINGEFTYLCTVKIPSADYEYDLDARYEYIAPYEDGSSYMVERDEKLLEYSSISTIMETNGINEDGTIPNEEGLIPSSVTVTMTNENLLMEFGLEPVDNEKQNMEYVKQNYPDGISIGTEENPGYGYQITSEYGDAICLVYQVTPDVLLYAAPFMGFEGPYEELGLEEFTKRAYDLISLSVPKTGDNQ